MVSNSEIIHSRPQVHVSFAAYHPSAHSLSSVIVVAHLTGFALKWSATMTAYRLTRFDVVHRLADYGKFSMLAMERFPGDVIHRHAR